MGVALTGIPALTTDAAYPGTNRGEQSVFAQYR